MKSTVMDYGEKQNKNLKNTKTGLTKLHWLRLHIKSPAHIHFISIFAIICPAVKSTWLHYLVITIINSINTIDKDNVFHAPMMVIRSLDKLYYLQMVLCVLCSQSLHHLSFPHHWPSGHLFAVLQVASVWVSVQPDFSVLASA